MPNSEGKQTGRHKARGCLGRGGGENGGRQAKAPKMHGTRLSRNATKIKAIKAEGEIVHWRLARKRSLWRGNGLMVIRHR